MDSYEKYRWEAECHKKLLNDLPQKIAMSVTDKAALDSAKSSAKWSALGLQFPVIVGLAIAADRKVSGLPGNKKAGLYIIGFSAYYFYHQFTKSWAWHRAFKTVEPIVEQAFASLTEEELLLLKGPSETPS
mmetsp:Transcript_7360/g.13658  ORF Transcript_7360/g.13658 Transcript_7360/m.13658 type:complete len:131 (+) Transcript_7360:576-968(+)